jgi:hypothetical protein
VVEPETLNFFDANVYFGLPSRAGIVPPVDAAGLVAEMARAGVQKALAWHIAQHDASHLLGNQLLADAIRPYPQLWGCWTILPNQTGEFPQPTQFFAQMKAARVTALRTFPASHRFLLNAVSMGAWLEPMAAQRIPLLLSVTRGADWRDVYSILAEFPDLVCVVCDHGCWGMDRLFRPLLERYPNVYIDTAQYFLDGGLEALVADYGAKRILFSSGFPESYFGGMMMALKHAQISPEAKADIAGGNLARMLAEVQL